MGDQLKFTPQTSSFLNWTQRHTTQRVTAVLIIMDPTQGSGPLTSSSSTPLPPLDNTLGAWLLETFISNFLQGIGYNQTFRYFRLYPNDPGYLMIWVIILQIAETLNTVLCMHVCYYYLITNYFNPLVLSQTPIGTLKFLPVSGTMAPVITQLFYARRIYKINKCLLPLAIIATLLILGLTSKTLLMDSWLPSTSTDVFDHVGCYTVMTAIGVFNIVDVIFSFIWPNNLIYACISMITTKVYSNTFLVSLNTRQSLSARGIAMEAVSPFTSAVVGRHATRSTLSRESHSRHAGMTINIQKTVSTVTDRGGYNESAFGIELKDIHSRSLPEQDSATMKFKKDTEPEQNAIDLV
ncbi:hypothetical protein C8Q74DRAFT_1449117 [Fomes fomentarius]|nr:hypothetical protein C8Q74DRAFT_1449117 [Fomes fomentarius]